MPQAFSIYLDAVRFVAALLVYVWHSNQRTIVTDILPSSTYGHSSVIVFFVLSGFVISYVTRTKENRWTTYASSRLSRVYSVVIPTIVLTPVLDAIGRSLGPEYYGYPFDRFFLRVLGSTLLLNESWISITYFSNVPYWSIAFESWYYVLFGLAVFAPSDRRLLGVTLRAWLITMAALVAGPKILLLLPVWLLGVGLDRWNWTQSWSRLTSWLVAIASVLGIVVYHTAGVEELGSRATLGLVGAHFHEQLAFAKRAPTDFVLGLLVFLNFAAMRRVCDDLAPLMLAIARPVRWFAGFTFTLYLLHQPLFLFWAALLRGDPSTHRTWWLVTALTLLSVWAVGSLTEQRRLPMRRWLASLLGGLTRRGRSPNLEGTQA